MYIWGYGAPTKATLILNMLGDEAKYIQFIVDDNDLKRNKFIPDVIPILSKSNYLEMKINLSYV